MVDIKLNLDEANLRFDLLVEDYDLQTTDDIETAVFISLFTDRRARADDRLPGTPVDTEDRRGWWGDLVDERPLDEIGSHLWLLEREVNVTETIARAQTYAKEAVDWLIKDGLAKSIDVKASAFDSKTLLIEIILWKNNGDRIPLSYEYAWR